MPKRLFPTSISPILKGLAKELGLEKGIASAMLQEHWKEIVGPQIASHTYPMEIRFDTLPLRVDSAVWMHQLSFLKGEIIEKCNRILGGESIRKLQLRTGPLPAAVDLSDGTPKPKGECSSEEAAFIERQLASIPDPELKEAVRRALQRHLLNERRGVNPPAPGSSPDRAK